MNDKPAGIDWRGNWSPFQYGVDMGWDFESVEKTAMFGLSDFDAEHLTSDQCKLLHQWCMEKVNGTD